MRAPAQLAIVYLAAVGLAAAPAACSIESVTFTPDRGRAAEDCSAPGDEDGNGLADCSDPACTAAPTCAPACGNAIVDLGEQCDDGNTVPGDGCDEACRVERFATTAPVKISGDLACTTALANTARKIAVDGSGAIYAVMTCNNAAHVAVSYDRGKTFSPPLDLLPGAQVAQVAIAAGPPGVAHAGIMLTSGEVFVRTTQDSGATWRAAAPLGVSTSTSAGLSLQAFNDDIYVGFVAGAAITVARNHARGAGSFELTSVAIPVAFFDLLYDVTLGTLAVCTDTPTFHVRRSSDGGASFDLEVNPPGSQFFSDWAIGNGRIFVSGASSAELFVIPASAPTTSSSVSGLLVMSSPQTRSVAADAAGNAFVASQLDPAGVQLDRLASGATAFDAPRLISPLATWPIAAALPGDQGAAVVFTIGTEVWVTIQAY